MATFIDECVVEAKAGDGGDGCVSWRREKYVPRGGPAGGDGGNGGAVIFVADPQMRSLLDYKYRRHLKAKNGEAGRSKNMYGAAGEDERIYVPVGTTIFDADTEVLIVDLTEPGQEEVVCQGGSGGWGNTRFMSATRQAPDFSKPGLPGETRRLRLSLKLLADVGLLGFPNAGKSTFLSKVSSARPKIADYPFTTLKPQLGVVAASESDTFVIADIPGLIEGAAEGAGLGIRFLKHLERVEVLCHLIEAPTGHDGEQSPLDRYHALRREVEKFSDDFKYLPELVVITKIDVVPDAQNNESVRALAEELRDTGGVLHFMSSATGEGIDAMKHALYKEVVRDKAPKKTPTYDPFAGDKMR